MFDERFNIFTFDLCLFVEEIIQSTVGHWETSSNKIVSSEPPLRWKSNIRKFNELMNRSRCVEIISVEQI